MSSTNFLKETIDFLKDNRKSPKDVISVGTAKHRMSWDVFSKHANVIYDNGFGGAEIMKSLIIYGKDFVAFRNEYDGSEWWQMIDIPESGQPNIDDNKNISFLAEFEEEHVTDIEYKYTTQQTCHNFDVFYEVKVLKSKTWDDFDFDDYFF